MNVFQKPQVLYLLIPIFLYAIVYYIAKLHLNKASLKISNQIENPNRRNLVRYYDYFPFIRFIPIVLVVFALAEPGSKTYLMPENMSGIDMMIAIDVSGSMVRSNDFRPKNRLDISKDLIKNFIHKRINDRLGLVIFAGAAYLQSPLTGDKASLTEIVNEINESSVSEQGTAIGDAIILSTYRLKHSKAKSKVLLVITDGVSNTGKIDVTTAAKTAKQFGVKIYTIGIGKELPGAFQVDFESLNEISILSGGLFYRATDPNEFAEVLNSIDELEKDLLVSKPEVAVESYFYYFLNVAILLFAIDLLIRTFYLRYYL
ncbi:MAG: VWA domain-containing protein [Leptospiraceae bacterium]|nr:VWA domain-containing protein [Leptospiraceae bacterium]MCP5494967.1 VWA domain-containing protein [Leptospiraceae bacterium]